MKGRQFSKSAKPSSVDQSGWTALPGEKDKIANVDGAKKKRRIQEEEYVRPLTKDELLTREMIQKHVILLSS